ncbi:MAG: protein translocase subunit SecF [Candidatus Aenigmarchaeota archaeon]|nr:protein translocase subunit SecF [Candidatus Aenigmarchaeota archaeon]
MFEFMFQLYHLHNRKLLVFSLLVLALCVGSLFVNYARTGEFAARGVSLKGGITLTVPVGGAVDIRQLQTVLSSELSGADINVRGIANKGVLAALIVEASDVEEFVLLDALRAQGIVLDEGKYSVEVMGSGLGQNFFRQTFYAVLFAFLCMSLVVYVTFRDLVPSFFVILAAFSDIVSTLAVVSFFEIKLSTAGIAAFLMLIGYSVDTDILLTTRVLKRKEGSLNERIESAVRTGLLMSLTSLVAVVLAYFFTDSDVIRQIMFILLVGLCFDVLYTWAQNAGILRLYLERGVVKNGQA